jgi:hypothetical protein
MTLQWTFQHREPAALSKAGLTATGGPGVGPHPAARSCARVNAMTRAPWVAARSALILLLVVVGAATAARPSPNEGYVRLRPSLAMSVSRMPTAAALAPGRRARQVLRISNTGPTAEQVVVETRLHGDERLIRRLHVVVYAYRSLVLYRGPLIELGRLEVGSLPARASRTITFAVLWPRERSTTANPVQGASIDVDFVVTGHSTLPRP